MADETTPRPRPVPQILIAAAFLAFVAIGVVTVLIPALSSEPEEGPPQNASAAEDETSPNTATSE